MASVVGLAVRALIQPGNKELFVAAILSAILKWILSMALCSGRERKKEEKNRPSKETLVSSKKSAFLEHEQFPRWCSKPAESKP